MSGIEQAVTRIVSQLPGYEPRPQQLAMAKIVAEAIRHREHAIIEAGTGSGKSFGYLIPILKSGKKAVVSTATIALQEQLLRKDLPFLQQTLGREVKVALAKGRANYICLRKLFEIDQATGMGDPHRPVVSDLIAIAGARTWNGDRADLPFLVEPRFWSENLASDSEDCLGPRCHNFAFTPHRLARATCEEAELIVANHALYFTDLVTGSGVLPNHDLVVFDEAHHLERAALAALTLSVNRWTATKLLQRVQRRLPPVPPRLHDDLAEAEGSVLEAVFRRGRGQFALEPDPEFEEAASRLGISLGKLANWIQQCDAAQMKLLDTDGPQARQRAEIQREQMTAVAEALAQKWEHFGTLGADPQLRAGRAAWLRVDPGRDFFELHSAPLDVAEPLREILWSKRPAILTSATLAVDGGFDFLKRELGLEQAREAVLGSPFEFEKQALLYVPDGVPFPNAPNYLRAILPLIERLLRLSHGRAFVLFTSYRALREVSATLIPRLPFPCKTQEELPRQRLLDWFRSTPNSVLFATATFWEGVDIPGDALSCVIIDKLPFASPDDPVVQARTERMKAAEEDWFNGYMLPKAIISLKQGFGRLIRSREDTGLVAILDRRLLAMRYGPVILRSLPPARRISALPASLETWFQRNS